MYSRANIVWYGNQDVRYSRKIFEFDHLSEEESTCLIHLIRGSWFKQANEKGLLFGRVLTEIRYNSL